MIPLNTQAHFGAGINLPNYKQAKNVVTQSLNFQLESLFHVDGSCAHGETLTDVLLLDNWAMNPLPGAWISQWLINAHSRLSNVDQTPIGAQLVGSGHLFRAVVFIYFFLDLRCSRKGHRNGLRGRLGLNLIEQYRTIIANFHWICSFAISIVSNVEPQLVQGYSFASSVQKTIQVLCKWLGGTVFRQAFFLFSRFVQLILLILFEIYFIHF